MNATIHYTDSQVDLKLPANTPEETATAIRVIQTITNQNYPTTGTTGQKKPVTRARWTDEEDQVLQSYVTEYGDYTKKYLEIARDLAAEFDRTIVAIIHRWNKLYRKEQTDV